MTDQPQHEEGFCVVPGGKLYYQTRGSGPALLFIHAGIADHRMWDTQVPAFSGDHQVIRYDCRGFGRTVTEDVPFSNRADVIALLDHLGVAQATLIGCSRGGQIALDTALEYPDRVTALVWVCSGINGWQGEGVEPPAEEMELEAAMAAAEAAGDWERTAEIDVRLFVDGALQPEGRADPAVREAVYTMVLNSYRTVTVHGQAQPLTPPAIERLEELRLPLLAIVGDLDSVYVSAAAELLAKRVPQTKVVHFPDAAHMPSMEQPERFNNVMREFVRGI